MAQEALVLLLHRHGPKLTELAGSLELSAMLEQTVGTVCDKVRDRTASASAALPVFQGAPETAAVCCS